MLTAAALCVTQMQMRWGFQVLWLTEEEASENKAMNFTSSSGTVLGSPGCQVMFSLNEEFLGDMVFLGTRCS